MSAKTKIENIISEYNKILWERCTRRPTSRVTVPICVFHYTYIPIAIWMYFCSHAYAPPSTMHHDSDGLVLIILSPVPISGDSVVSFLNPLVSLTLCDVIGLTCGWAFVSPWRGHYSTITQLHFQDEQEFLEGWWCSEKEDRNVRQTIKLPHHFMLRWL